MLVVNFETLYGFLLGIDYVYDIEPDGVDDFDETQYDLLRFHFLIFAMYILIKRDRK
tara:strand:- start:2199 stop:2369 length:171 start_codon:yes stop_codon:yes gene_type:complete